MTIWSSRQLALTGLPLLLAGCLAAPKVTQRQFNINRPAPETIAVANKSVIIGGPPGYCIDKGASRLAGDTAFVLLGSCASISRDAAADAPAVPGLLTASVARDSGAEGKIGLDALESYIGSARGKAALARDGQESSVQILETVRADDALFVHLKDTSVNPTPGLDDTYWRGLFDLNGRLITVSVVSFSTRPLSSERGFATLSAFSSRIRRETPAQTAASAENTAPKARGGVLQKLFR